MSEERDPALRASDADRDAVATRLRDAHAEGRLTPEEFDQRLDATFAARTVGDLAELTADLPVPAPVRARTGDEPVAGRSVARREGPGGLRLAWAAWLTAVLVNVAVWGCRQRRPPATRSTSGRSGWRRPGGRCSWSALSAAADSPSVIHTGSVGKVPADPVWIRTSRLQSR